MLRRADLAEHVVHQHARQKARKVSDAVDLVRWVQRPGQALDSKDPKETRERKHDADDVGGVCSPVVAVEIPVATVGVRGVEVLDEVVAVAQEEVVGEHDANEIGHEDTHAGHEVYEDGTRDDDFPGDHGPAADEGADELAARDVDVARSQRADVDTERNQVCHEVSADLRDHEDERNEETREARLRIEVLSEDGIENQRRVPQGRAEDLARAGGCHNSKERHGRRGPGRHEQLADDLGAGSFGVASDVGLGGDQGAEFAVDSGVDGADDGPGEDALGAGGVGELEGAGPAGADEGPDEEAEAGGGAGDGFEG